MRRALVLVAVVLCMGPTAAAAKDSPEDVAARVSRKVMSPFCDGVTLHDCPSQQADELRLEIAEWARAGVSEEQIIARLEDRYGSVISGSPDEPLAWVVPLVAVIAGMVVMILLALEWGRRGHNPGGKQPPDHLLTARERARVEAELSHFNKREML